MGFIQTMRPGDTGIGYTFESLLGIPANSATTPDFKGIEIKTKRGNMGGLRLSVVRVPPHIRKLIHHETHPPLLAEACARR